EAEDVPARAASAGARLAEGLAGLRGVTGVRGLGLLLAAELAGGGAGPAAAAALERGLVVNPVTATALRLAPPLLVTDEEVDEAVTVLGEVLDR
ncbi:MAG: aminotransferase class III-fold pyridoxal phosphate-dependent enzyme, partial [Acidimicrobiales bacterium]